MEYSPILFTESELQKAIKAITNWYYSFIPLAIASVIFVFCFIFESNLPLYVIMAFFFVMFIFLYTKTTKQITHKDGYTFIQAMSFYKQTEKDTADSFQLAKQLDYAENLTTDQILILYETGKILTACMKKK